MAKKQNKIASAKTKPGKTARSAAKKTPSGKPAVPPARAVHAKASVSKSSPARHAAKTAPKNAPVKKTARPAHPKPAASKTRPAQRAASAVKPGPQAPVKAAPTHAAIDQKTLDQIRELLMRIRDRLSGQIHSQSNDSLKYVDDASSEDRTDDFDREFALNLVSSEHDALFEVNSALRRIEDENYGLCDGCSQPIEKTRLRALPFTRMCIKCQSEHERGRKRFRPFGETISQYEEPAGDAEEAEAEEHE